MATNTSNETVKQDNRQRLIRLIHVAKRDLDMDDDTYRSILRQIGNKSSAADLSVPNLEKVLEHLKRSGFKVRSKGRQAAVKRPAAPKSSRPLAQDAESKKIRALWLFMHQIGVVKNPSEDALAAYVKRIVGVDALQWISGEQAETLIETLKKWAMRFLPGVVEKLAAEAQSVLLTEEQRVKLNGVLGRALSRRTFDPMASAWEALTLALTKAREEA